MFLTQKQLDFQDEANGAIKQALRQTRGGKRKGKKSRKQRKSRRR